MVVKKNLTPDVSIISCLLLRKNTEIWPWDFRKITHQQKTERSLTIAYLTLQVFEGSVPFFLGYPSYGSQYTAQATTSYNSAGKPRSSLSDYFEKQIIQIPQQL